MAESSSAGLLALGCAPILLASGCLGSLLLLGGSSDECRLSGVGAHVELDEGQLPDGSIAGYSGEQLYNAALIINAGQELGLDLNDQQIAVMTAMGESSLVNLGPGEGDRDSVGLFQQRPSQGWGTPEELADPTTAATTFYEAMLASESDRASVDPWVVAYRVQRPLPGPEHYRQYWDPAGEIITGLADVDLGDVTTGRECQIVRASSEDAQAVVDWAMDQVGKPYIWGGNGPDGYDCSGLVHHAYAHIGLNIPRVTHDQVHFGPRVTEREAQPGDLIFIDTPAAGPNQGPRPRHVAMVVDPDQKLMVEARCTQCGPIATRSWEGSPIYAVTRPLAA